ncbi:MAG: ABC transporter permease [Anaerolineae bacterium]|nr:ABC transporter permease [Anaerolineae bacterium]
MRKVIHIAINELRVNFGHPVSLFFLFVLPLVFTMILGLALGSTDGPPTIRLDVVDLDGDELATRLVNTLREVGGDTLTICDLTEPLAPQPEVCNLETDADAAPEALAAQRIEDGVSYAAIVIPDGFSAQLLAGEDVTVAYRANANLSAPTIIRQSVDAAIRRVSGSVVAARLSVDAAQAVGVLDDARGRRSSTTCTRLPKRPGRGRRPSFRWRRLSRRRRTRRPASASLRRGWRACS